MSVCDLLGPAVLSTPSDGIIAADRDGVIRFWNAGAQRIFGFARDEAIGQSLDIIISARLRERHWAGYRHAMATGASRYGAGDVLSVPALRKDGKTISVEFTVVLLKGAAGMEGIAAIMRDVTQGFEEMRRLRKLAEAAKLRSLD